MTTPIQNKLLQALTKSVCTTDDVVRDWPKIQQMFTSINAAPFAFLPEGVPNDVLAFDEEGRPMIENIRYAVSGGTENGPPIFIAPAAANNWLGLIQGWRCRNIKGEHREVDPVVFLIRGRDGQTLSLPAGTPFAYWRDRDGNRVMLSEPTNVSTGGTTPPGEVYVPDAGVTVDTASNPFWCKAQHQWQKNSGTPRVAVKCLDAFGGSEVGAEFYVYIRGGAYATGTADKDPNVVKGQTIECKLGADNTVYTTDPTAWGPKIGSVVGWILGATALGTALHGQNGTGVAISGLVRQDNSNNTTAKGGSGRDWETNNGTPQQYGDNWPPFYLAIIDHTDNLKQPAGYDYLGHSHPAWTDGAYSGVTVAAHPDHSHRIGTACTAYCAGSSLCNFIAFDDSHDIGGGNYHIYTGIQVATGGGGHSCSAHAALTLTHSVTDPLHAHNVFIESTYQYVWYKGLLLCERVDNSFEILGV